jgi:hypothetical protein
VNDAAAAFEGVGFSAAVSENYAAAMGQFALSMGAAYKTVAATGKVDTKDYVYSAVEYGPQKFLFQSHIDADGLTELAAVDASSLDPNTAGKPLARFVADRGVSFQAYFEAMTDENFAGVKAQILYNEILANLPCNPVAAVTHLGQSADYLQNKGVLAKYFVRQVANSVITDYKETASYRNNVDVISKAITDLRSALRTRISGETWLSDAGKTAALAKVNSIRTHILVNNDNASSTDLSIPTYSTSLYANLNAARLAHWATIKTHADASFYTSRDLEYPFTANAYYVPSKNGIIILFGYLAAHNDFAAPITLDDGTVMGNIVGGQVLPEKPDENRFRETARELGIDEEKYIQELRKVNIRSREQIQASFDLLTSAITMFVRTSYAARVNSQSLHERASIISSLGTLYFCDFFVDLTTERYRELDSTAWARDVLTPFAKLKASEIAKVLTPLVVTPDFQKEFSAFADFSTLKERLKGRKSIALEYISTNSGWCRAVFIPVRIDETGAPLQVIFAIQDINEEKFKELQIQEKLRKAAEEATEASKAKTDFLSRMSHDIRTPLNGIVGMTYLAQAEKNPPKTAEYLKRSIPRLVFFWA